MRGDRDGVYGDVLPIVAFMLVALSYVLTRVFGAGIWMALLAMIALAIPSVAIEAIVPSWVLWGRAYYLLALAAAAASVILLRRRRDSAAPAMALAACTFFLAFAMRSLDSPICSLVPLGTHFLWHLLDAAFVFQLAQLVALHGWAEGRASR